jgi:Protein of unknown function (DUF4054)
MTWTAKDPNEILDYAWPVPLDAGDTIATHTAVVASGTVVIVSSEVQTGTVIAWVSGGVSGETALIRLTANTAGGRVFEATFPLQVVDSEGESTFKAIFPAFADTPREAVAYWQARAASIITDRYGADQAHATMLLTAHYLTMQGHGGGAMAQRMSNFGGATRVKSGSLELAWDGGGDSMGFKGTVYGQELLPIIRANNIGGVTGTGTIQGGYYGRS